jgi:uncharacterized membrane protein YgdD (TMEM256/DUF423 family)
MNLWSSVAAFLMAAGVGLGAFGAHALKSRFDAYQQGIWEKAVFYHLIHALAILAIQALPKAGLVGLPTVERVSLLLLLGILLFSGSLYTLAFTGVVNWGAVTPFGGVAFLIGWIWLGIALTRGPI